MFDVDHVEVLRGPQGTLYGRNATAGAINIQTAKPTFDRFKASASGEIGNYGLLNLAAAVNVPLSDTLAVRVAGSRQTRNGYADNGRAGDETTPACVATPPGSRPTASRCLSPENK